MESALGWIGELFSWFGSFVPRWLIVRSTEAGVKFRWGKHVHVLTPGIRWYWPAFTDVETETVVRQTLNLDAQTLMTADDKTVVASGVIVFKITDIIKFLVDNFDADEAIAEVAGSALRKFVISKTVEEIQKGRADVDNSLTREAQKLLKDFGIEVEYARLVSFSTARVINLVGIHNTSELMQ